MECALQLQCDVSEEMPEADAPVKIVLAYENHAGFQAAMEIYRAVVQRLTGRFEFRESWLPFNALAEPQSLERAANVAAEAEMVFCCPGNPYLLPGLVQDWIRLWLTRRRLPDGALVLLLPTMAGRASRQTLMERDLRATAQANGLAFFAAEYAAESLRDLQSTAMKTLIAFDKNSAAAGVFQDHPNVRHWGIND